MKKIDKHFVSDADRMLAQFNQQHTRSQAQQQEHDKYLEIIKLRDKCHEKPTAVDDIWD